MSVFHAGERRLQKRAGVAERMADVGNKVIFNELPLQHQQFYPLLPLVFIAAPDLNGQLWASVLCGARRFAAIGGHGGCTVARRTTRYAPAHSRSPPPRASLAHRVGCNPSSATAVVLQCG